MKQETLAAFEKTVYELQQTLVPFDQQLLNTVPFEGSWTAAQVVSHVQQSQSLVAGLLYGKTHRAERNPEEKIQVVKKIFLDFSTKLKSPDLILPPGEAQDKEKLLSHLETTAIKITAAIETLPLSEICEEFALPAIGEMTRMEWMYFVIYHTQRHIHQLENISKILLPEIASPI